MKSYMTPAVKKRGPYGEHVVGGRKDGVAQEANDEQHDQGTDRICVHREFGTDVPERVDPCRPDDCGDWAKGVTQSQVKKAAIEEGLEKPTDVQLDGGTNKMGEAVCL